MCDAHSKRYYTSDLQAPFWGHLKEALAKRQHRNLLFLFYEDMKENLMGELKRLDAFLGTGLTEEQLQQVADHTSISQMKNRPSVGPPTNSYTERARKEGRQDFIRKGMLTLYYCQTVLGLNLELRSIRDIMILLMYSGRLSISPSSV